MNWLTEVWSPASTLAAVIGGMATGALVISRPVLDPMFASGLASARAYGILVASLAAFVGAVFFTGQAIDTLLGGGPADRVVSRFTLWLLFSAAVGTGVYLRVRFR